MKSFAALAALALILGGSVLPASARSSFVIDNAHLLSAGAISSINGKVADFSAQTGKEIVVDTEMTVDGTAPAAAEKIFAAQQINGVLIYVAKSPKTIGVVPDRAASKYFPSGTTSAIRTAIRAGFNSGDFDGGINNGVDLTLSQYRSHLNALPRSHQSAGSTVRSSDTSGGGFFNMSLIIWLIVLAVVFFIVRGIFRAIAGPRIYPGGGGPGYGGPGYGPGYGGGYGGGGGGGFFSGLLGGLGGAFLGNELFGGNRNNFGGGEGGNNSADMSGGGAPADSSGFQSDAGQADMGNASFGGYGDSGGGWGGGDSGGGGGDFGGGGGGGDSGGGW